MDVRFSLNLDLNHCIATSEEFSCFNSARVGQMFSARDNSYYGEHLSVFGKMNVGQTLSVYSYARFGDYFSAHEMVSFFCVIKNYLSKIFICTSGFVMNFCNLFC